MGDSLRTYLLVSEKTWHDELFGNLQKAIPAKWFRVNDRAGFSIDKLEDLNPDYIFIPHWSYIIPKDIYSKYKCVVFHMTDLPFGRGGSPLQNLIVRGFDETVISAIQVEEGIDTGDVYLKKKLSLAGTAKEIFIRSTGIIEEMIGEIVVKELVPQPQQGDVVTFKRRKREDGDIATLSKIEEVYDYIRMLDCEGYPPAYIETENFIIEFSKAEFSNANSLKSHVRITKK